MPWPKGKKHSEATKRKMSEALTGRIVTQETCQRMSDSLIGRDPPPGSGNFNFNGGATGESFACVLCPAGYKRHVYVYFGPGVVNRYELDFAHLEAKVNIELDGPGHKPKVDDVVRDATLRSLGWKIIRIKHN